MAASRPYLKGRRLRVFGGPNGSGKSTIFNKVSSQYDIGYYLNADEIEKQLENGHGIDLKSFEVNTSKKEFNNFVKNHPLEEKAIKNGFPTTIELLGTSIISTNPSSTHSYEASILADFVRQKLIKAGKKFTFETVMSHPSKVDLLEAAGKKGYKTYLYFICTESAQINIERVNQRVRLGGHPVATEKVVSRYFRSLETLKKAVKETHRTFLFDNSGKEPMLILEVYMGKEITFHHHEIPKWVDEYLLKTKPTP